MRRAGWIALGAIWLALAAPHAGASVSNYVIVVSVDGLGSPYLQSLISGGQLPTFSRLQSKGAWTNNARDDYDYTVTLPNHTSIVTGRGVTGDAGHGWTDNVDPPAGATIHTNKGSYVSSVFDVAHDAGLRTGLFAGKSKFSLLQVSYPDKIDTYDYDATTSSLVSAYLSAMNSNPFNYSLLHIKDPDAAGSWGSTNYNNAVKGADEYLGDILSLIQSSPVLNGHTTLIVTADHGGAGNDHSDAASRLDYTIPFYAWGAGVSAGQDLYAINAGTRFDPGTTRPLYSQTMQPIRDSDSSNLALGLLGLGKIPGSMVNTAQDLRLQGAGAGPAQVSAYSAFNETPIGVTAWSPGSTNTELGFSTTVLAGPWYSGATLGSYDSSTSPRRFRMMGYEARTTFSPVSVPVDKRMNVSIDILIKDTTYESDDYFRAVITNGTSQITLADVSGDALNTMPKLTFMNYSAPVPYSWTQASLQISSHTNSSTNAEAIDFDDIFFTNSFPVAADIDAIYSHFGPGNATYDVNGDGAVNQADVTAFLQTYLHTNYADATLDGHVNIDDFSTLLAHWGSSTSGWAGGDFTGDRTVNIDDFSVLLSNWGWSPGFAAMQAPEPGSFSLLVLGGLAVFKRRSGR